ncbi:apolipoprotein N-acyltransferase [Sphaerotilus sp.]|uniref:apolipoprotein N-acyltransferase n=1 Tax=Sphaerotilus sp. TaxID=2093942 RepID=UPI0025E89552|nr:apolipoprotein N-acyltransferase [Sphaerotilus sp.]
MADAALSRGRWCALLLLAVLAGAAQAWSMAPVARGWLQVLSVAALAGLVRACPRQRAGWIGGAFGVAWLAGTFWWLFISMYRYGHLPAWLAGLAVAALAAALSAYLALAMAVFARWQCGRLGPDLLLWSALWLLAELGRGVVFTGFPWGAAGYAHVEGPLAALAPWVGVYGMGAAAAALGWLVQRGLASAQWGGRTGAVLVVVALAGLPGWNGGDFTRARSELSVTLLQGNVPQDEKFDFSRLPETLDWHLKALLASQADLVVAPETAIPLLPAQLPQGLWMALLDHFGQRHTRALIGVPLGDAERGYTNSVAGLGAGAGESFYRYDKHHLVPFGEFIPLGFRWFVDLMQMPLGDFARGPLVAQSFAVGAERVGPNICYEDLFGEELAARFVDPAAAPTVLANVSNIGWFGESVAVDQHLLISRLRTLELQRPMVRATNTGATVAIDHRGVVTHRLAPHVRGVLEARVQAREGTTPFAWWAGRFGLWPLWGLGLLGVVLMRRRA